MNASRLTPCPNHRVAAAALLPFAPAAIILELPDLQLAPNLAGQTFTIFAENDAAVNLTGVQLEFMVADGGPDAGGLVAGPEVEAMSLIADGLLFAANHIGDRGGGALAAQVFQRLTSTASGQIALGAGTFALATVTFDTTGGIAPGDYEWTLASSLNGSSFFTGIGGDAVIFPTLLDGTLTVVPEPQGMAMAVAFGLGGLALWRRRH